MSAKIRKGDNVEIISGRSEDKGKRGEVIKVDTEKGRVVVQGVNLRTKHQKQVQTKGRTVNPGMLRFESSVHVSNVMLVCPKCGKPTRVGVQDESEKKSRICKKCSALIDE
ncbi:MAG: 50S ribosomal protein L24 [Chloroflexi bacterium HGW-Chloroflexi-10]|jgi:large subunit ribosomal protein L24|nr:MAG: 50S ribosomal protein L24 [Chloroflexi bacterium HGW-Chloroflexi-10]